MLILVRHASPAYDEHVPPTLWPLSSGGLAAARDLQLPAGALLVSSDEVKAIQTIEHAGPVIRDSRFGEVRRVGEPWNGPYRELRRSYVEGFAHEGWEPHSDVVRRFQAAIDEFRVPAGSGALVVATHGMAMTVWLHARGWVSDPGSFWAGLRFPDVIAVEDLDAQR